MSGGSNGLQSPDDEAYPSKRVIATGHLGKIWPFIVDEASTPFPLLDLRGIPKTRIPSLGGEGGRVP